MLQYDSATEHFVYGRARFGKGSAAAETAAALAAPLKDVTGVPGWQRIVFNDGEWGIDLAFRDGVLHGGSFVALEVEGDWEAVQNGRRVVHEATMQRLFGTQRYESKTLLVYPFCHPRDGIEQISFEVR